MDDTATITGRLEGLRSDFPGCRIAIFVDLSTGMVLSASAQDNTRHEALEELCAAGVEMLNGSETAVVQRHVSAAGAGRGLSVINREAAVLRCFIGSPLVAEDALCLACDVDMKCASMLAAAAEILHAIGQEG